MDKIYIAWYSETLSDHTKKYKLYDELSKLTLKGLFEEFDKVYPAGEGPITDYDRYEVIKGIIADKLELIPRSLVLLTMNEEFETIYKRVDELERQFENHRHNVEKTYGEKPVW